MDGLQLPQGQNHFQEAVYFLLLSSQNSWYSFYQRRKDKGLSRPWSHPVILNMRPLDQKSSALTNSFEIDQKETLFSSYLDFLSQTFTIHSTAGGGGYLFNSSLPFPPVSQTIRHQPNNYCRKFTSAHSLQQESNQEPGF